MLSPFYPLLSSVWVSISVLPYSLPISTHRPLPLELSHFLKCIPVWWWAWYHIILIRVFPVTSKLAYCLWVIRVSLFLVCELPVNIFSPLFDYFFKLICRGSLYLLDINPFPGLCIANIISQFVACLWTLWCLWHTYIFHFHVIKFISLFLSSLCFSYLVLRILPQPQSNNFILKVLKFFFSYVGLESIWNLF